MNSNLTEIGMLIDDSSSMGGMVKGVISGFNEFLEGQRKLINGKCNFTLSFFNHEYRIIHDCMDINDIPFLNSETYSTSGCTAYYDALGKMINNIGTRLNNTPEEDKPSKILIVIFTDGEENASTEFTLSDIKEIIEHQKTKYSWEFIFLAANIDAKKAASDLNIGHFASVNYSQSGIKNMFSRGILDTVTSYCNTGKIDNLPENIE